ncbi:MAG: dioxygenase, partial [Gammaproteobacteria bacterium]
IVLFSAHWEEPIATITAAVHPELIHDYYGFPPEAYDIAYPCPGEPAVAQQIAGLLQAAQIESRLDQQRGLDHGVFVPLKIMYPEADIPVVQVSLSSSLDPLEHVRLGQALHGLHHQNILVMGSGGSFHNLKAFMSQDNETISRNHAFEQWLETTCCGAMTEEERIRKLIQWEQAPGARFCHPREEHLLPLHVCYGVAGAPCSKRFEISLLGKTSSMVVW